MDDKKVAISLKLVTGPIEVSLYNDKAESLVSDLIVILHGLSDSADLLKEVYSNLGASAPKLGQKTKAAPPSDLAQLSVSEMIRKSGAKTEVQKILLIAYYLLEVRQIEMFAAKDIDDEIAKARVEKPGNLSQQLNNLVGRGMLNEADKKDGKKTFKITRTGEDEARGLLTGSSKQD